MAKEFAAKMELPPEMVMLTDPKRRSFKHAGLMRSAFLTLSPLALFYLVRAMFKGFRQGKLKGDPWQQGGAVVVSREGRLLYRQVSFGPGHHASPAKLLAAVPSPA